MTDKKICNKEPLSTSSLAREPLAFVRLFKSECVQPVYSMKISGFVLAGASRALSVLGLSNEMYILNVIYAPECGGDTQLFVTGSVEAYEAKNPKATAMAEIKEETQLVPKNNDSSVITKINSIPLKGKKSCKVDWFACPINGLEYKGKMIQRKKAKLPYNYKVGCIVYGTKSEIHEAMSSFKKKDTIGNDNIIGLCSMSVKNIKYIISTISRKKIKLTGNFLMESIN